MCCGEGCVGPVAVLSVAAILTFLIFRRFRAVPFLSTEDKAVLVTGCDTGIGHALAQHLARLNATVYACCLNVSAEGATALKALNNPKLHVIQMDVTKDGDVTQTLEYVKKTSGTNGLWGVVNNAGLNFMGDVELTTMEQFERVTQINQLGMVRVTKAFLPLVRTAKGRVLNVTSVKGRLSCVFNAAYGMTKFAGETFSDILRQEMHKFGVKVVIIEPGNFGGATGCLEMNRLRRDFDTIWDGLSPELRQTYGRDYVYHHLKAAEDAIPTACPDLSRITDTMVDGLFSEQPRARYMVGGSSHWYDLYKWRALASPFLPEWYLDNALLQEIQDFPVPDSLNTQRD